MVKLPRPRAPKGPPPGPTEDLPPQGRPGVAPRGAASPPLPLGGGVPEADYSSEALINPETYTRD